MEGTLLKHGIQCRGLLLCRITSVTVLSNTHDDRNRIRSHAKLRQRDAGNFASLIISLLSALSRRPATRHLQTVLDGVVWRCSTLQNTVSIADVPPPSSSSFYLFIKQFHKNTTADNTRTGPTRLTKHSQWPQQRKKQKKQQLLGL